MQESHRRILHGIDTYIHTLYVCMSVCMYVCMYKCGYQLYVYLSRTFQEINSTLGEANITTELVVPQENPHHLASIVVSWTICWHIRARKTHKFANCPRMQSTCRLWFSLMQETDKRIFVLDTTIATASQYLCQVHSMHLAITVVFTCTDFCNTVSYSYISYL